MPGKNGKKTRGVAQKVVALTVPVCLISGCANMDDVGSKYGTLLGCATGAVAGAGIAALAKGNAGAIVAGAIAGGAVGCYAGNVWQKREQALHRIAQEEHLQIQTETLSVQASKTAQPSQGGVAAAPAGVVASVESGGMFATDSDTLNGDGRRQIDKLAQVFKLEQGPASDKTVLMVVGHTDASGSVEHNQELSERRAQNVARILAQSGIDASRIYYEGAGSSRPVADNGSESERAKNRRVEIVEVASTDLLVQRIQQERANPVYLTHSTDTAASLVAKSSQTSVASRASSSGSRNAASVALRRQPAAHVANVTAAAQSAATADGTAQRVDTSPAVARSPALAVDFGGQLAEADQWSAKLWWQPKRSGWSLISSARADAASVVACNADRPRVAGQVKNLGTNAALAVYDTREYLPGMNGRAWAGLVNGNLVTVSPVALLKDDAKVVVNPGVIVTENYAAGDRKAGDTMTTVANAYDGENSVLYRVFVQNAGAPLSCFDVVLPKDGARAPGGRLYYDRGDKGYAASFAPSRT